MADEKTLKIDVNYRETRDDRDRPVPPSAPSVPSPSPSSPSDSGGVPPTPPISPPVSPSAETAPSSPPPSPLPVPSSPGGAAVPPGSPPTTPPVAPGAPPPAAIPPAAPAAAGGAAAAGLGALTAAIPPAVIAVGAAVVALGGLVIATEAASAALSRIVDEVGKFSPEITGAQAEARLREIEAKINQAGRLGGEGAEFVRLQSETDRLLREIGTDLMEAFFPIVKAGMEAILLILKLIEKITSLMEWFQEKFLQLGEQITGGLAAIFKDPLFGSLARKAHQFFDESLKRMREEDRDASNFQQSLLDALSPEGTLATKTREGIFDDERRPRRHGL